MGGAKALSTGTDSLRNWACHGDSELDICLHLSQQHSSVTAQISIKHLVVAGGTLEAICSSLVLTSFLFGQGGKDTCRPGNTSVPAAWGVMG